MLSLRFERWELGPIGGVAFVDGATPFAGVTLARRWSMNEDWVLITGARLAFSIEEPEPQPRGGLYLGVATRLSRDIRVRAEIGSDSVSWAILVLGAET